MQFWIHLPTFVILEYAWRYVITYQYTGFCRLIFCPDVHISPSRIVIFPTSSSLWFSELSLCSNIYLLLCQMTFCLVIFRKNLFCSTRMNLSSSMLGSTKLTWTSNWFWSMPNLKGHLQLEVLVKWDDIKWEIMTVKIISSILNAFIQHFRLSLRVIIIVSSKLLKNMIKLWKSMISSSQIVEISTSLIFSYLYPILLS